MTSLDADPTADADLSAANVAWDIDSIPVSYTHLRAHETYEGISFAGVWL